MTQASPVVWKRGYLIPLRMVDRIFTSSNLVISWLRQIKALRSV